jgi:type I site-specific restriction-modification system R (restriction) subunit
MRHVLEKGRQSPEEEERQELLLALRQAEKDLNTARSCFAEAVDPDIIDELIYLMQAASKKYSYFLKKLRSQSEKDKPISSS